MWWDTIVLRAEVRATTMPTPPEQAGGRLRLLQQIGGRAQVFEGRSVLVATRIRA